MYRYTGTLVLTFRARPCRPFASWYTKSTMKSNNLSHLFPKYEGKWVALAKDQITIVGSGSTLKTAINKAKKIGHNNPIMFKVPVGMQAYVGSC